MRSGKKMSSIGPKRRTHGQRRKILFFGWGVVEERGRTMKTAQFGFSGGGGGKRLLFNVGRTDGCKEVVRKIPRCYSPRCRRQIFCCRRLRALCPKCMCTIKSHHSRVVLLRYILSDVRKEDSRSTTACVLHYEFIAPDSSCKSTHTD